MCVVGFVRSAYEIYLARYVLLQLLSQKCQKVGREEDDDVVLVWGSRNFQPINKQYYLKPYSTNITGFISMQKESMVSCLLISHVVTTLRSISI